MLGFFCGRWAGITPGNEILIHIFVRCVFASVVRGGADEVGRGDERDSHEHDGSQ